MIKRNILQYIGYKLKYQKQPKLAKENTMGIVTLIIAAIMYILGWGNNLELHGMDQYVQNVASVETFFFQFSLIFWAITLGLLYQLWQIRWKILSKVSEIFAWIWTWPELPEEGLLITILRLLFSLFGSAVFGTLIMFCGITILGLLLLPIFEGLSAGIAQQMAATWTPNGMTQGFVFYAILWFLLIGG